MPGSLAITCWLTSVCPSMVTVRGTTATGAVTGTVIGEAMTGMPTGAAMAITIGGVIMTDIMAAVAVMEAPGTPSPTIFVVLTAVRPLSSILRPGPWAACLTKTVRDRDGQVLSRKEARGRFTTGVLIGIRRG